MVNPGRIRRALAALAFVAAAGCGLAASAPAWAEIVVNVDQGATQPLPIAVTVFAGDRGADLQSVVAGDLGRSGLFKPFDLSVLPKTSLDADARPAFDDWKGVGAQALLVGRTSTDADGRLWVDFRLWDVYAGEQLLGLRVSATSDNWRRVAHKVADAVYSKLTGAPGYFDSRIAFVSESGARGHLIRKLAVADQDGVNGRTVTDGAYQVFFPRFSPDTRDVVYMALRPSGSTLYRVNLQSGRQEALGRFPGMVFAPAYSADGSIIAFSGEKGGNTDIYVMTLAGGATTRLTSEPAIDTSPSFSPDGAQIVFNSDRGGSPQLYVMNADGSNLRRLSFGGGRYTAPVWSPDGRYIAFTKQEGQVFHIGVVKPDGSGERLLTTSYLDEGPAWAPNSRVILFSRDTGYGAHLWSVDLTGRVLAPSPYNLPASDPAWSPLLP